MAPQPQLIVELDLYLCSANAILARLAAIGPAIGSVVLVGHNPDLHEVALRLAGDPAGREGRALRHKFPTAAIAVFDLPGADWRIPAPGGAKLAQFWTPPQH
jgi:phosphohistidine phosphatase